MNKKYILFTAFILSIFLIAGCQSPDGIDTTEPVVTESMDTEQMDTEPIANEQVDNVVMEAAYMDIGVSEALELIESNPDLIIIDVSPAYDRGHLPGAVNYYLGDGSLDEAIPSLDPNKEYLVYCHGDAPAIAGAQKLIDAGFKTVYRLEGNYGAWVDAGYPIEN